MVGRQIVLDNTIICSKCGRVGHLEENKPLPREAGWSINFVDEVVYCPEHYEPYVWKPEHNSVG